MKKILLVAATTLLFVGMLLATGIDANPIQALYALGCAFAAVVCYIAAEKVGAKSHRSVRRPQVYDYAAGRAA